jgi:hypothetical protein
MRATHIQNAEIINYLMGAYCPVVAQLSGLNEQAKQARIDLSASSEAGQQDHGTLKGPCQ